MNILEQIQTYAPSIEKEKALSFAERASSLFLNTLPELVANNHFVKTEIVDNNGIKIGNRYSYIIRGNYSCRKTRADLVPLHIDESSSHFASPYDPVYYINNGKLFVLPEPTEEQKAFVSKFPDLIIDREELPASLPNLPKEASDIILLYAGFFSLFYLAQRDREEAYNFTSDLDNQLTKFESSLPDKIKKEEKPKSISPPEIDDILDIDVSLDFNLSDILSPDLEIDRSSLEDLQTFINVDDIDTKINTLSLENLSTSIDPDFKNVDLSILLEDIKNINSSIDIDDISFDINVPQLDLSYRNDIELPSYSPPSIEEPTADFANSESALNNAKRFIGEINEDGDTDSDMSVPKGAYWLDDEDPEMVRSSVELAAQEVNRASIHSQNQLQNLQAYNQLIKNNFQEFKAQVESFGAEVDFEIKKVNGDIQIFRSELEAETSRANSLLKNAQNKLQAKLSEVNTELQKESKYVDSELNQKKLLLEDKQAELQAQLQIEISNVQNSIQKESRVLDVKSNEKNIELQNKRSEIEKELSSIQLELSKVSKLYDIQIQSKTMFLQKYINTVETELTKAIQSAQIELQRQSANIQNKLSEYSANIQLFQVEISSSLQDYQLRIQENIQKFNSDLGLASSYLQPVQSISQKFQMVSASYTQRIQEAERLYQQYIQEVQNYIGADNANERPVRESRKR